MLKLQDEAYCWRDIPALIYKLFNVALPMISSDRY